MSTSLVPKKSEMQVINESRPAYLAELPPEDTKKGTEGMAKVVRPSFIKIVQGMSASEIKKQFGEGAMVLLPDVMGLTSAEEKISFIPILWWQEWCKWTPLALKGIEPMIQERSFDPKSKVAIKAQSPSTWREPHPKYPDDEKMSYRYQEHLNFLLKLVREDLTDLPPCLISFSKSNYKTGTTLNRLALRRGAPLMAQQFVLGVKEKPNQKAGSGTFWVNTIEDDREHMWASDADYAITSALHDEFFALMKEKRLEADYEPDDNVDDAEIVQSGAGNKYAD